MKVAVPRYFCVGLEAGRGLVSTCRLTCLEMEKSKYKASGSAGDEGIRGKCIRMVREELACLEVMSNSGDVGVFDADYLEYVTWVRV